MKSFEGRLLHALQHSDVICATIRKAHFALLVRFIRFVAATVLIVGHRSDSRFNGNDTVRDLANLPRLF